MVALDQAASPARVRRSNDCEYDILDRVCGAWLWNRPLLRVSTDVYPRQSIRSTYECISLASVSTSPVVRMASEMSDGEDNQLIRFDAIHHGEGEALQEDSPRLQLPWRPELRSGGRKADRRLNGSAETAAETLLLFYVVDPICSKNSALASSRKRTDFIGSGSVPLQTPFRQR